MNPTHALRDLGSRLAARWRWALLVMIVVVVDQISKVAIVGSIDLHELVTVIPGLFDLTHTLNPGGVWGLGRDLPAAGRIAIFLALPAFITVVAAWYSLTLPVGDRMRQAAIALVVGGAIGNLIDRLRLGKVIDFLAFHVGDHYWPTFNVADSAICVGIAALLVTSFWEAEADDEADVARA